MQNSVSEYFRNKASHYDDVIFQPYWQLSDDILWNILCHEVFDKLNPKFTFMDAGGGTGRWTQKILDRYVHSRGVIIDGSPDMLGVAQAKFEGQEYHKRISCIQADFDKKLPLLPLDGFDVIFNLHNVIGFVTDPTHFISTLHQHLRSGGRLISLVPNRYHCAFFNIKNGNMDLAEDAIRQSRSKFVRDMPAIHLFDVGIMKGIYENTGLCQTRFWGFPNFIFPGYQETQLHGNTESLIDILSQGEIREKIFKLELQESSNVQILGRSNNILVIGNRDSI